jgi:hypothetical protein
LARSYAAAAGFSEVDYVAGLWMPTLLEDLLWTMNDQNTVIAPSLISLFAMLEAEPYISPSWSWANRGRVSYTFLDDDDGERSAVKPEYDRLETQIAHRGKDPLGAITHAELRITGRVSRVPAQLMLTVEKEKATVTSYANDYQPRTWVLVTEPGEHEWQFHLDWDPEGKVQDCDELRMLVLGSFETGPGKQPELAGLLIRADGEGGGESGNKYKRAGVFRSLGGAEQPPGSVEKFLAGAAQESVVIL